MSVEPIHRGKHLVPRIVGESFVQFFEGAGADPSEYLTDGRFKRVCPEHTILPGNAASYRSPYTAGACFEKLERPLVLAENITSVIALLVWHGEKA